MMKNIKRKSIIVSSLLSVVVCVIFLSGLVESVFSGTERGAEQDSGFVQARSLEGNWVRPDGGYKLVIEDVKPDGSLKASYFNPSKINVHEANWRFDNGSVHIFIELQDVNYRGSKYSLIYINEKDVFEGTYFLAAQKQTFGIEFLRIPKAKK